MDYSTLTPGRLISYRKRDWIVLPGSPDEPNILKIKPLGGSDHEITGVFLPLSRILPEEKIKESVFPGPEQGKPGSFRSARQLFDASRLLFRNASGPFRCVGKLSFRPRAYQMVPLVMALKQEVTRLLIADDVGIGKTIEALMIVKELLERGDVRQVAVLCPPHLCEQWQQEFKEKLEMEAVIIRSGTAASLDRILPGDVSPFSYFPVQVISIDYLKTDRRRDQFRQQFPDLIIVDEAHTCSLPAGSKSVSQQQRHQLVSMISKFPEKHLVLLTATPHSGKEEEFRSLLGLLKPEFGNWDLFDTEPSKRRKLADHFIQRKRDHILTWLEEDTPFPLRESREVPYYLSNSAYDSFLKDAMILVKSIVRSNEDSYRNRVRYWAALGLLRGLVSSPDAGIKMLQNRSAKLKEELPEESSLFTQNPLVDAEEMASDAVPADLLADSDLSTDELTAFESLEARLKNLRGLQHDPKAAKAVEIIKAWLKIGQQPIIFCRFIETANYIGEILKSVLPKSVEVSVITSVLADDQRREQVAVLSKKEQRILVATDCLSEGINLQDAFTAVLHYDLPWNPNRLEQREGRVDRFGQMATPVYCYLLWGADNPIDKIVLDILIKKVRDIQRDIGVTITIGEENGTIMDAVMKEVFRTDQGTQLGFFGEQITTQLETAKEKAKRLRDIFAHQSIPQEEIKADLKTVDSAIGNAGTVERFTLQALQAQSVLITEEPHGWKLRTQTSTDTMVNWWLGSTDTVKISFYSPVPRGYRYIGRNHPLVEHLAQKWVGNAFDPATETQRTPRLSVLRTHSVKEKTVLILFRVRNVIREVRGKHEVIAEEMVIWGYSGIEPGINEIQMDAARTLLETAESVSELSPEFIEETLNREMNQFSKMKPRFLTLAEERAEQLVTAHLRFKSLVGGRRYEKVVPVLPPDILGFYVLVPVV